MICGFCLSLFQRFVRTAVSTEADASLPTDVFALTASLALSAREVMTFPQSLYITLSVTAEALEAFRDFALCGGCC